MRKHLNHILIGILSIVSFVSLEVCSSDQTSPLIRIRNERREEANIRILMPGDSTITIDHVKPKQTTVYMPVCKGTIIATAIIQNERASHTATFYGGKETRFTVVIQKGDMASLRIDQ